MTCGITKERANPAAGGLIKWQDAEYRGRDDNGNDCDNDKRSDYPHYQASRDLAAGTARQGGTHCERDRRQEKWQDAHLQEGDVEIAEWLQILKERKFHRA